MSSLLVLFLAAVRSTARKNVATLETGPKAARDESGLDPLVRRPDQSTHAAGAREPPSWR
jgi:hypothetical protein